MVDFKTQGGLEMAKFKSNGEEQSSFLKVEDVPNRDIFTIEDEAVPYKGKFTKGEESSVTVRRKKDGAMFTLILKTFNINNIVNVLGEESSDWIGKEIEVSRKFTPRYNKNFLAVSALIPEVNL